MPVLLNNNSAFLEKRYPTSRKPLILISLLFLLHLLILPSQAQQKDPKKLPPTQVVVAEVKKGEVSPEVEFIGSVYYREVSEVASEVSGRVKGYYFEEGQSVKKGQVLVRLSSELLEKDIKAKKAQLEELKFEIEKAEKDFNRVESLYREDSIAEQVYDEYYFRLKGLEARAEVLEAEIEKLEEELKKKSIRAPFDGIVIKRDIDRGEWLSPGRVVATVARLSPVDVIVNVPERILPFVRKGLEVEVRVSDITLRGKVYAIVPRGDLSTRTFPVKIELKGNGQIKEGMEAEVRLPSGNKIPTLLVPRDAIVTVFGKTVVFTVLEGKAQALPVQVVGYQKLLAGVLARGLKAGMKVVVKGQERLRNGQPVNAIMSDE